MDLGRVVVVHVIRFVAASQSTWALVLHGMWILLGLAMLQASDPGTDLQAITRPLLRAFAWLGGFEDGRADEGNIARAMALLTLPFYLLAALRRSPVPERVPLFRAMVKWGLVSGLVAFAGYVAVFVIGGDGMADGLGFVPLVLALVTGVATAWAVLATRVGDILEARLTPAPGAADPSTT